WTNGARRRRCIWGYIWLAIRWRREVRMHSVDTRHGVDLPFLGQSHVGGGLGLLALDVGLSVRLGGCPGLLLYLGLLLLVLGHPLQQLVLVLEATRRNQHVAGDQARLHRGQLHQRLELLGLLRWRGWPFLDRNINVQV